MQPDMLAPEIARMDGIIQMTLVRLDALEAMPAAATPLHAALSNDREAVAGELLIRHALQISAGGMAVRGIGA